LDPSSLFNLDQRIRVGIENFLWAAAVGGIASAVGEIFLKEKLAAIRKSRLKRHYAPFILVVILHRFCRTLFRASLENNERHDHFPRAWRPCAWLSPGATWSR
jgi:hypothetical protein